MESSTWDFDAPEFVDFGANEHEVAVGRDSYFDYDHEVISNDEKPTEIRKLTQLQKESGRRLTFDTPVRAHSKQNTVSISNNVSEGSNSCQSEDKAVAMKTNAEEIILTTDVDKNPVSAKPTDNERNDEDTPNDLPKEDKVVAMKANSEEIILTTDVDKNPVSAKPTDNETKEENTPNDLPKDFSECTISSTIPAKESRKSDRSAQRKSLRRSKRIAKNAATVQNDEPPAKKKYHLTHASTPTVLRRQGSTLPSTSIKSTAEMELAEVERLKREQKKRLKENTKSLKAALAGPARPPSPAKFPRSKVEHKSKSRMESTKSNQLSSSEFPTKLRQYHTSKSPPKMTKVQPFRFSTRKRKHADRAPTDNQGYRFHADAKAHTNFETRQTKRAAGNRKEPMKAFPTITAAKTPKLLTKTRSRPVHVISNIEKEELELIEIKKHSFKAKPVDHKILEGPTALPEVEKRDVTHPEEFHLHLGKRVMNIVKKHLATTVAQSPNFQLKKRMEVSQAKKELKATEEKENLHVPTVVTKAPVHKVRVEKKTAQPEKHYTQLQPFSFDRSDKQRFSNKEARIEAIHEAVKQKANSFRAQPIVYEPDPLAALPPKNAKPPTKAQPFHLESDSRGHLKEEKWKAQIKKEEEELKAKAEFKASTEYQKIITKCGFKPVLTERQNCHFDEFELHTTARATERHQFDEKMKHREALIMQRAKDVALEAERRAEEEARKQRKDAEHHAAPIRKYTPVVIKESEKLPTIPQSPKFSTRFKI